MKRLNPYWVQEQSWKEFHDSYSVKSSSPWVARFIRASGKSRPRANQQWLAQIDNHIKQNSAYGLAYPSKKPIFKSVFLMAINP